MIRNPDRDAKARVSVLRDRRCDTALHQRGDVRRSRRGRLSRQRSGRASTRPWPGRSDGSLPTSSDSSAINASMATGSRTRSRRTAGTACRMRRHGREPCSAHRLARGAGACVLRARRGRRVAGSRPTRPIRREALLARRFLCDRRRPRSASGGRVRSVRARRTWVGCCAPDCSTDVEIANGETSSGIFSDESWPSRASSTLSNRESGCAGCSRSGRSIRQGDYLKIAWTRTARTSRGVQELRRRLETSCREKHRFATRMSNWRARKTLRGVWSGRL